MVHVMNMHMSTNPAPNDVDTQARWGFERPSRPTVSREVLKDFVVNAPVSTVIEYDDDLYEKIWSGEWRELELLVPDYNSGSTHERHTAENLLERMLNHADPVFVMRVGDNL